MKRIFDDIQNELTRAGQKYAPEFASMNEALGTIRAEYRELEDAIVQHQGGARIREEAVQVAAMAVKLVRYIDDKDAFDRSAEHFEKEEIELEQQLAAANARLQLEKGEKENWIETAKRHCRNEDYYRQRAEQAEAQNKRMREALEEILESPYVLSEATIPKRGIEAAPEQVVGTLHVGLIKYRKAKAALEEKL